MTLQLFWCLSDVDHAWGERGTRDLQLISTLKQAAAPERFQSCFRVKPQPVDHIRERQTLIFTSTKFRLSKALKLQVMHNKRLLIALKSVNKPQTNVRNVVPPPPIHQSLHGTTLITSIITPLIVGLYRQLFAFLWHVNSFFFRYVWLQAWWLIKWETCCS